MWAERGFDSHTLFQPFSLRSLYVLSHFFLGNSIKGLQEQRANNLIAHS